MTILLTGASRGIGYQVALQLIKEGGHKLILVSRTATPLYDLENISIQARNESLVIPLIADISTLADNPEILHKAFALAGTPSVVIHNAAYLVNKKFTEIDQDDLQTSIETNFIIPFRLTQFLIPLLKEVVRPHVVFVGSMSGYQGSQKFPGLSLYSATKAALSTLAECLAAEYSSSGISFNCIAPGAVQTEMLQEAFPGFKAPVTPEEMASFIIRFSQTAHHVMNGKVIPVAVNNP